jgi:hypothetical protein
MDACKELRLAALALLIAACATNLASCSRQSPGLAALVASREATRAAQSWQEDTAVQLPSGQWVILSWEKTECPGRQDHTVNLREPHLGILHDVWFDGAHYSKEAGRTWMSVPDGKQSVMNCGQGPSLIWDGILYDDLDAVQRFGEVRAGKLAQPDDVNCTWWEVAPAKGAPAHYSVCVGTDDHLPRVVHSRGHDLNYTYTLSHWNSTKVTLPEELPAAAN